MSALDLLQSVKLPLVFTTLRATYVAHEMLARGNGGYVFRISNHLVVKVIPHVELSADELYILTNLHSAHLLHAVDHGLILLHLSSQLRYFYFFILPYHPQVLQQISFAHTHFTQRIQYIRHIYSGLMHLNHHSFVHGDLHPKNVMISHVDQALLIDFNLSYNIHDNLVKSCPVSTLPFCSPLSLINNGWVKNAQLRQQLLLDLKETLADRTHAKCDLFAFAQLVSWILFDGDSFLIGSSLQDIDTYVANTVVFAQQGDSYLMKYISSRFVSFDIHAKVNEYLCVYPHSSLRVSMLFDILYKSLKACQSERGQLPDFDFILSW
jgi:serine/threonine protein kinase